MNVKRIAAALKQNPAGLAAACHPGTLAAHLAALPDDKLVALITGDAAPKAKTPKPTEEMAAADGEEEPEPPPDVQSLEVVMETLKKVAEPLNRKQIVAYAQLDGHEITDEIVCACLPVLRGTGAIKHTGRGLGTKYEAVS